MSPTVSLNRRSEPAYSHRSQPLTALISAAIRSAISAATFSGARVSIPRMNSIPLEIFSSLRAPKPLRSRSLPSSIDSASSSTELIPRSV